MSFGIAIAGFVLLAIGAAVKGILGIGLPMIAIPGLALLVGLPKALAIVALPVAAANLVQIWQFRRAMPDRKILLPFIVAGGIGTALGTSLLISVPEVLLEVGLAAILAIYIAMRLMAPTLTLQSQVARRLAAPVGFAAGLLHGFTGISGPIGITYFHAQRPTRPEFIFSTGAMFFVFTAVQVPVLGMTGLYSGGILTTGLLALPAVAFGLWVGNVLARRIPIKLFDNLVLGVLGWTALALLWRAYHGG